ncbi:MAG: hypothetical protein OEZ68_06580 [Gammaproteobacteria bacterium]|nr:hypothetical protein [Gammaproteobacteria bacterium]
MILAACGGGGGGAGEGGGGGGGGGEVILDCNVCMSGKPSFAANTIPAGSSGSMTVPISTDVVSVTASLVLPGNDTISLSSVINSGGTSATFDFTPPTYIDVGQYYARITVSDGAGNSTRYTLSAATSTTQYTMETSSDYGFNWTSPVSSGINLAYVTVGMLSGVPYLTASPVLDPIPMVAGRPATATLPVSTGTASVKVTVHDSSSAQVEIGAGTTTHGGSAGSVDVALDVPDSIHYSATAKIEISDSSGNNISRYFIESTVGLTPLIIQQSTDAGVSWSTVRTTAFAMSAFNIVYPPTPVLTGEVSLSPALIYAGQTVEVSIIATGNASDYSVNFLDVSGVSGGTASVQNGVVPVPIGTSASGDYYPRLVISDSSGVNMTRYTKQVSGTAYEEEQSFDSGVSWGAVNLMAYNAPVLQVVQALAAAPTMTTAPLISHSDVDTGFTLTVDVATDSAANIAVNLVDSTGTLVGTGTAVATSAGTLSVAVTVDGTASPGAYYPMVTLDDGSGAVSQYSRDAALSVVHYALKQSSDSGVTWSVSGSVGAKLPWLNVAQPIVGAPVLTGAPSFDKTAVLPGEIVTLTLPVSTDTVTVDVSMIYQTCPLCGTTTAGTASVTNSGNASIAIPITMGDAVTTYSSSLLDYSAKVVLKDVSGQLLSEYEPDWGGTMTYRVRQSDDAGGNWISYMGPLMADQVTMRYYSEGTLTAPTPIGTAPLLFNGVAKAGGSFGVFAADDGFDSYYSFTVKPYTSYSIILTDPNNNIIQRPFKTSPSNDPTAVVCTAADANTCIIRSDSGQTTLYVVADAVYTSSNGGAQYQFEVTEYPAETVAQTIDFETGVFPASLVLTYSGSSNIQWAISTAQNTTAGGANSIYANIPAFENNACFSISVEGMARVDFNYIADTVRNVGDFLTFYVNGVQQGQYTAKTGWTAANFALSGVVGTRDMLSWCLNRDPMSSGLNPVSAYVDDIVLTP